MFKKTIAVTCGLAMVLSLGLTACGSESSQEAASQPSEAKNSAPAETSTPEEAAGTETDKPYAGTTINFLADSRSEYDTMLTLIDEFESETGITVNYTSLQETQMRSKTALEVSADSTDIDVVMVDFMYLQEYAKNGYLADLTSLFGEVCPEFSTEDYMDAFIDACTVDGSLYGVPLYQDCNIMVLRGDLLEKYNLKIPETYDELMNVAKTISEGEGNIAGIAMRGAAGAGMNEWTWPTFLSGFGGAYYDDNYNATLNSANAVEALTYYRDILKNYGPSGVANYSYTEVQNDIMQGNAAIMIDSATLAVRCENPEASTVAGKLVYAPVPSKGDGTKADSGFYSWILSIPEHSARKEAAAQFVEWLTSKEIAGKCGFSAPNSALESTYNIVGYDGTNMYDVMIKALENSTPDYRPRSSVSNDVGEIVSVAISETLSGEKEPEAALNDANAKLQEVLNKIK